MKAKLLAVAFLGLFATSAAAYWWNDNVVSVTFDVASSGYTVVCANGEILWGVSYQELSQGEVCK